jgi:hypothetical protein
MKNKFLIITFTAALGLLASCGGSTNNDQGTAFSLIGLNPLDTAGTTCQADTFTSGIVISISDDGTTERLTADRQPGLPVCRCRTTSRLRAFASIAL